MPEEAINCDTLIIGSGPGGAITSYLLSKNGQKVILVDEGSNLTLDSCQPYSLEEMNQKYRNDGLTLALGSNKLTYIEAKCVGGGSEINSGLYHRVLPETIDRWKNEFKIKDFDYTQLLPFFKQNEEDLSVSQMPVFKGKSSLKLKEGADLLGWEVMEVPRWWKYHNTEGNTIEQRQSMTETFVPWAIQSGCKLISQTRALKIIIKNKCAKYAILEKDNGHKKSRIKIFFKDIFVCCGAIQTPALLRRSGITNNIGNNLRLHPMIRTVASFDEDINEENIGVPPHQVTQFKPEITLGCSNSSIPHLALWLSGKVGDINSKLKDWRKMALFYSLIVSEGKGYIRNIIGLNTPFVYFSMTKNDYHLLEQSFHKLCLLLFKAGAREIFTPIQGTKPIQKIEELENISKGSPLIKNDISTIHVFSSCPMGEDKEKCAVNSYGKLHGYSNIYINDSSMLPGPPGVNPQGTIMAIVRRNVDYYLRSKS
ncbi:MAG: GMC family oxidoreductase [Leptospiraceae bacterium]|nr:GMC family oxidoreductase [Leptospiraceae bacterium]